MKNIPTEDQPSDGWIDALQTFDADLRRRGAAEKTRRAYGIDVGQFALWASKRELEPGSVTPRALRRYAAALSERGAAPSTVARKLASLRAFYRSLREHGAVEQNPADLLTAPKKPQRLPKVLKPEEVARLLDRIPATTPLELRDRALFELAYASGLRSEELVSLDLESLDFDAEEVRVEGKGSKTRVVPAGEHALAARRPLRRARTPRAARRRRRAGAVPVEVGKAPVDVRRAAAPAHLGAPRRAVRRCLAALAAPLLRHPPARGRCRFAGHSGDARPCEPIHDSDLHSGRVSTPEVRLRPQPSPGLMRGSRTPWKRTSKPSSSRTSGGSTASRATSARASGWSSPTRRW